jgi:hypothetical protein
MRLRLELLQGRLVRDADGRRVGHVSGVLAERVDGGCVVHEVLLGPATWLHRLGRSATALVGLGGGREPLRVPWSLLSLDDPERPRLRVSLEELRRRS